MKQKLVLGIETSCDDTSVAILQQGEKKPVVMAHQSFSQEEILKTWGGVIPEVAARNHLAKITPLLEQTFKKANCSLDNIDLVSVTTHPGLLGPLLTGLNAAKTLCLLKKIPLLPVNHLYAHLEAIHLTHEITYPYIGLIVSGGHSLYMLVKERDEFEILGSTIDDAAGEAFDKGGKLMGLGYPAGKIIDEMASKGDPKKYSFPIGLKASANCQLSFSGVKTALRHFIETNPHVIQDQKSLSDLCASYQKSIVDALELKLRYAIKKVNKSSGPLPIVVGGGVACNSELRKKLKTIYKDHIYFVEPQFCTDNGAMIANYGLRLFEKATHYPECLYLDARGKYIDKALFHKSLQSKKGQSHE